MSSVRSASGLRAVQGRTSSNFGFSRRELSLVGALYPVVTSTAHVRLSDRVN